MNGAVKPSGWLPVGGGVQRRFAVIAGLVLLLTSVVFLVLVTSVYRARILDAHERASVNVNLLLQAALENSMIKRDLDGLQEIVARLGKQAGIAGVMIVHPDGEIRFSSYTDRIRQRLSDPDLATARDSLEQVTRFRDMGETEVLRSINPVRNREICQECHGTIAENPVNGLLVVDYDSSDVRTAARNGALLLGGLGICVIAITLAGLWLALRRIVLDRVEALSEATGRLAAGDLSVRMEADAPDELGQLSRSFNSMGEQLEMSVEKLSASEAFLLALVDSIPDAIRVIDAEFRVVLVNQAYCDQISMTRDEVIAVPCFRSSHDRSAPCTSTMLRCPVAEILHGKQTGMKCNHTHISRDGARIPVEVRAVPAAMTVRGQQAVCVVESIRDLQAQVNISQEQRLAEMGMLAAGVAHEVLNPLGSISLALRAISHGGEQTEASLHYIDIAEKEIANCQQITESLLRLAAPSQDGAELVEMARVVAETTALLRLEAEQTGVILTSRVDGHPRVLARDSDMRILIFNLALNAIHAMPGGGDSVVSCKAEADRVLVRVTDTGVGIEPRDRDKVLLPFWNRRADGTRGRGLGLSICSTIVDKLGGELSFESEVGRGTVFTIALPNADRESQ